jgi:hypothetical protein
MLDVHHPVNRAGGAPEGHDPRRAQICHTPAQIWMIGAAVDAAMSMANAASRARKADRRAARRFHPQARNGKY